MLEGMVRRLATRLDLLIGERDELLSLLGEARERVVALEDGIDRLESMRAPQSDCSGGEEQAASDALEAVEPVPSRLRAAG